MKSMNVLIKHTENNVSCEQSDLYLYMLMWRPIVCDFISTNLGWLGFADITASLNPVLGLYLWFVSDIDLVFPPHVQSNKAPIFQTYCSVLLNLISNQIPFTKDTKLSKGSKPSVFPFIVRFWET